MTFEIYVAQGRTIDYDIALFENDGTTEIVLAAADVVRFKAGKRQGATPDLDIDSAADTSLGSGVTFVAGTNDAVLRISQGDTAALAAGVYDAEVSVVDDSETVPTDALKSAELGALHIFETMGGDSGIS